MVYKVAFKIAFLAALAAAAGTEKRVNGGLPAQASEFPYIVKVGPECGGTLLDSTTVLTAGHCWRSYENDMWVESPAKPGLRTPIIKATKHPNYVDNKRSTKTNDKLYRQYFGDDVAILKLSTPLEGGNISYAKLPPESWELGVDSKGVAAGWGTGSNGILQKVELSLLKSCEVVPRRIPVENEFCAEGKKGVCKGDSGGPIVDKDTGVLIGVATTAICGFFSSFIKVSKHIPFIEQHLAADSDSALLISDING